jgi:hypothetical protein
MLSTFDGFTNQGSEIHADPGNPNRMLQMFHQYRTVCLRLVEPCESLSWLLGGCQASQELNSHGGTNIFMYGISDKTQHGDDNN